jgi:hypothetical protein
LSIAGWVRVHEFLQQYLPPDACELCTRTQHYVNAAAAAAAVLVSCRLGPLLREFLQQYLPPDAHELCSGNTHVAVTRLLPYWQTQMISQFNSRDDLISALLTSCHIPW